MSNPPKSLWFHYLTVRPDPEPSHEPPLWEQPYYSEKEAQDALDADSDNAREGWMVIGPYVLDPAASARVPMTENAPLMTDDAIILSS